MNVFYNKINASSSSELADKIQQFMTNCGFSLHDDYSTSSGRYLVYVLPSSQFNEYVCLLVTTDVTVKPYYYYHWSSSTHTGVVSSDFDELAPPFFIVGQYPNISIISSSYQDSTISRVTYFSNIEKVITQDAYAGSYVRIYLNNTNNLYVNNIYGISTGSLSGRTCVKATSVYQDSIVVESLNMDVPSGSKLLLYMGEYAIGSGHIPSMPPSSGTGCNPTMNWNVTSELSPLTTYGSDFPILAPIGILIGSDIVGIIQGFVFSCSFRSTVTSGTLLTNGTIDKGYITSYTSTSITDSSKNWSSNSLVGKKLAIPNTKDAKIITANTSNTITVNDNLFSGIQAGMQYFICDYVFLVCSDNRAIRVA